MAIKLNNFKKTIKFSIIQLKIAKLRLYLDQYFATRSLEMDLGKLLIRIV